MELLVEVDWKEDSSSQSLSSSEEDSLTLVSLSLQPLLDFCLMLRFVLLALFFMSSSQDVADDPEDEST